MFAAEGFADDCPAPRLAWIREHLVALERIPAPGAGRTVERLQALTELAAIDGSLARLAEGHLDALAILGELGRPAEEDAVRGVWAARPERLGAARITGGWRLRGEKPWCSGADGLDMALVTATADDGVRLFDVDVGALRFDDDWHPIGMRASDSRTARIDVVVDAPVGSPGCYIERPGFWHGGIGVAACWHGLAWHLATDLAVDADAVSDPYVRAAAGEASATLAAGTALLGAAGRQIDDRPHDHTAARVRALTVRAAVERTARDVLDRAVRAQGAGALCFAPQHARAVADLTVYLGQFHHGTDAAGVVARPDREWWTS
jgi:alkylation response protein AidB-like acyl-CoA dehydrogenase